MKKLNGLLLALGIIACNNFNATTTTIANRPQIAYRNDTTRVRPDHVNNAESPYFPPVFGQDGGSCGSASRIGYMFTHEINAFRGADASQPENIYPTHFTWLLTNSHSGKEGMAIANGIPNSVVYGGTTYSKVFGNQDCASPDFGWMQGYDKWYSAMFNRIAFNSFSPLGVDTEKGREFVKNWLWNHQGDREFYAGGICGIGVASACQQAPIGNDPEGRNAATGLVGEKYVTRWGNGVDHALTIVGYDDRLVFDLDSNNVYGEKDKDECGAWIIVNSWGDGWANKGFIYCPYKYGFPVRQNEGGAWKPEFYHVRKNYRPLRTLKIRMDYSHRSEIKLIAGISTDLNATEPEISVELEHFKFAGDGRSEKAKNGVEAATPMLGKWADGKLHSEPMEFGYDLTDLSSGFDTRRPLKYFFIVERRKKGIGSGKIYDCSVIDYEFDRKGIETPLITSNGKDISGEENGATVTAVVQGEPFFAPLNLCYKEDDGKQESALSWSKPQDSHYPLKGYVIFKDGNPVDTLAPAKYRYICKERQGAYSLAALYRFNDTLSILSARTQAIHPEFYHTQTPHNLSLHQSGFIIPGIFKSKYEQATIEYWLKPNSWRNWNQSAGPGWGNFLIHANNNGALTVGWDGQNRIDTRKGLITRGSWYHFAFVISKDTLTAYVNGQPIDRLISQTRSGIGGFKEFPFASSQEGAIDGELAEVRIWKEARTQQQINEMMHNSFEAMGIPASLLAYYKGEIIEKDSVKMWRDFANNNHAVMTGFGQYEEMKEKSDRTSPSSADAQVSILIPEGNFYAGQAFSLSSVCSPSIVSLEWTAPGSNVRNLKVKNPTFIFTDPGTKKITLQGQNANGETVKAVREIAILPTTLDATFHPVKDEVLAGERISFHPLYPVPGYRYEWTMKHADIEKAFTQNAAAVYASSGDYEVKLVVKDPHTRKSKKASYKLHVKNVAPEVQFDITPMVIQKGSHATLTDRSRYMPTAWKWQIDSRRFTAFAQGKNPSIRMDVPGIYDITLTASNEIGSTTVTRKNALIVCNADSKNGLNFSNPQAAVTTSKALWDGATNQMTVEWWMQPASQGQLSGIGHSADTWQITADKRGRLTLYVDSLPVYSDNGFVIPGQWHHYAVTFHQGEVKFLRDGEVCKTVTTKNKTLTINSIPAFPSLRIGGEKTPMNATIDEFRVWKKALSDTLLQQYCNAPIENIEKAEAADSLMLYYSFNQNGGDVKDLTTHGNTGIRKHFGPDGDAWGRSSGVFCLNFETPFTDISGNVLPGSARPFVTTGETVNRRDRARFTAFDSKATGWTIENAIATDSISTGIYVDKNKGNTLCVYTTWDGFANRLSNHKLYRTVKLPAGKYELEIVPYQNFSTGSSRLAVAYGKGLPDIIDIDTALASASLSERRLSFILPHEAELSLGIVFELQGHQGIAIDRIILHEATMK